MSLSFDEMAKTFDHQRGLPRAALRAWVELIDQLAPANTLRVIEPGIGTGRVALPLAAMGHPVTGTDISRPMLDACHRNAELLGVSDSLDLHLADAIDLPVADQSFDLGLIAQLLYLVPDWTAVLDELARAVKPGGFVIHLTEPTSESPALASWSSSWREMIEATGYRHTELAPSDEDVRAEFLRRWPDVEIRQFASWTFGQTVSEAMQGYGDRIRPLYESVPEEMFQSSVSNFLTWAQGAFPDHSIRLEGTVTFTAMIART